MSLSEQARNLHNCYELTEGQVREATDEAFNAAQAVLSDYGYSVSNTDPAEELVAAIYKYFVDSAEPDAPGDTESC
jgi:hypothetical protein